MPAVNFLNYARNLYDNAAHRPALSQPEHKHTPVGIDASPALSLPEVLDQILKRESLG